MMTRPLLQTYTPFPFPFVQGKRDRVLDTAGRYYFDFYGGHCVCSTGHSHPHVVAAIAQQAKKLLFYSTAADIPVRHEAAEALIQFANSCEDSHLESVFFCNTGSEANENALKLAVKITGRYRFAAFDGGWHGRGMLPLSVTDDPKLSEAYTPFLVPCTRLKWNDEAQLDAFDFSQVAAVILEPIQSMAGVRVATPGFLAKLREVTAAAGALLILDEVQTGMGRLGQPYAAGKYRVRPDLVDYCKRSRVRCSDGSASDDSGNCRQPQARRPRQHLRRVTARMRCVAGNTGRHSGRKTDGSCSERRSRNSTIADRQLCN